MFDYARISAMSHSCELREMTSHHFSFRPTCTLTWATVRGLKGSVYIIDLLQ